MEEILAIDSISKLHELVGYDKPFHPLVTLIDIKKIKPEKVYKNIKVRFGYYSIALKSGIDADVRYGRKFYDFDEGSMVFTSPNQVMTLDIEEVNEGASGWMLCFHPELISGLSLAKNIDKYSFFSYDVCESLHLADREITTINGIMFSIKEEFKRNIDSHSRKLIVTNIELILNYSQRFYERQFITRETVNKDVISKFEKKLREFFEISYLEENGIPTVKQLAKEMGYSTYYLSDLLKKETGKSTQDYIHEYLIIRAKDLLMSSTQPIYQIGYKLGFDYPAHFSKFFKSKTGVSPSEYRA